jgi:hypothetical protein
MTAAASIGFTWRVGRGVFSRLIRGSLQPLVARASTFTVSAWQRDEKPFYQSGPRAEGRAKMGHLSQPALFEHEFRTAPQKKTNFKEPTI